MAGNSADDELIETAARLREEARKLLERKGLLACFDRADAVEVVGSVTTDLMTRRDIDITCCLQPLTAEPLIQIANKIIQILPVGRLTYINPSVIPWEDYKVGLFCGISVKLSPKVIWNLDIWAYAPEDYNTILKTHHRLAARLAASDRLILLRLKSACHVHSRQIYDAVLNHGVMDVEGFQRYLETYANNQPR